MLVQYSQHSVCYAYVVVVVLVPRVLYALLYLSKTDGFFVCDKDCYIYVRLMWACYDGCICIFQSDNMNPI